MKKSFKVLLSLVFAITSCFSVFAAGGVMSGEKNIRMVQTEYFDIIYGAAMEEKAALLYANADKIYEDLDEMYEWHKGLAHMPVVLTSKPELYNAWFWSSYYNHIVLLVTPTLSQLDNQPDDLLWTFRHELTHAFTYNMKSDELKLLDKVFSDAFSCAIFTVTPGMAEGATVTSESYEGNGRLNDEFAKQIVKQAKIENKFPGYGDTKGSSSNSRVNHYYYFNGAFHEYLQKTYGLAKYRDFWYQCVNDTLLAEKAFERVYNKKIKSVWKDFKESYKIPSVINNPVEAGYAKDFFNSTLKDYSKENMTGAMPEYLSVSKKGLIYLDSFTNTVYSVKKENLANTTITPERLFQVRATDSISQSRDGKYITVTYYDRNTAVYRSRVKIYDTDSKKWFTPDIHGIKDAVIITKNDDYYLVALHFENGNNRIGINKIEIDSKGNIKGLGEEVYHNLPDGKHTSCFTQLYDGKFAFISNERLSFSIQTMNTDGELLDSCYVPVEGFQNFNMHYLSANPDNPDELYFSWVTKDSMPRAGIFNLTEKELTFATDDISGGIFYPVICDDELFYTGQFYEYFRLFRKADSFISTVSASVADKPESDVLNYAGKGLKVTDIALLSESAEIFKYNPFKYMIKGMWFPVPSGASNSYDSKHHSSYAYDFGITYNTKNPWDDVVLTLSAGYEIDTQSFGLFGTYGSQNLGTGSTDVFQWTVSNLVEFDKKGLKADSLEFSSSSRLFAGTKSRFSIVPSVILHAGRSNETPATVSQNFTYENSIAELFNFAPGRYKSIDDTVYFYNSNVLSFSYDNYMQYDDTTYGIKGVKIGVVPSYSYSYNFTDKEKDFAYGDLTLFAQAYIPHLLPNKQKYGMITNLPVKLFASAFSTSTVINNYVTNLDEYYMNPDLAVAAAEILLFSYDIQKSAGPVSIFYFNDVNLIFFSEVGYNYPSTSAYSKSFGILHTKEFVQEIIDNKMIPTTVLALKLSAGINPLNIGNFVSGAVSGYLYTAPRITFTQAECKPVKSISFGIEMSF